MYGRTGWLGFSTSVCGPATVTSTVGSVVIRTEPLGRPRVSTVRPRSGIVVSGLLRKVT